MTEPEVPAGKTIALPAMLDSEAHRRLRLFVQDNAISLLDIIRSYVIRTGLAQGEAAQSIASDILHETVAEALTHAERFNPSTQPRAWLLGIAANIVKRKKADAARRYQRELLISDLPTNTNMESESDFFEQFSAFSSPGPEQDIESNEQVREILALVSDEDQEVLRLALLYDLDTRTLAQALHIKAGAARVRLHRALQRLRVAWQQHASGQEKR